MKKKILIVEDEEILAQMYKDKLQQEGFEAFLAFDASQGIEILKRENIDLILLDILLPREDGISFLKKMKNLKKEKSPLVIAFSNYDNPEIKQTLQNLGAKDYLIKANYTPQEVVEKIKKYF